jgi:drug/metabolite transporter (DMT)-like permease
MDWKILAVITPLMFVAYQALSKLLPKGTSVFLINAYASLIGTVVMLVLYLITSPTKSLSPNPKVIPYIVGIGLLISFGNFGIIKAYSLGAPQSLFTPLFYTALIVYGILVGIILFHEKLNGLQAIGMLLAVVGLVMIAYFRKS